MTGLDKIMEDIQTESAETVAGIRRDADGQIEIIRAEAQRKADAACAKVREDGERAVSDRLTRARSAAELLHRKKILAAKQELIGETIVQAQQDILALPADQYFELLIKIAAVNAVKGNGEISFNKKDAERLPADFTSRLQAALPQGITLTVSAKTADIAGGFILLYDGIEENCSLEAIFAEKREEMQDQVRTILFG